MECWMGVAYNAGWALLAMLKGRCVQNWIGVACNAQELQAAPLQQTYVWNNWTFCGLF